PHLERREVREVEDGGVGPHGAVLVFEGAECPRHLRTVRGGTVPRRRRRVPLTDAGPGHGALLADSMRSARRPTEPKAPMSSSVMATPKSASRHRASSRASTLS